MFHVENLNGQAPTVPTVLGHITMSGKYHANYTEVIHNCLLAWSLHSGRLAWTLQVQSCLWLSIQVDQVVRTCLYNHLWCTLQSKRQAPTATSPVHNIRRGNPLFRRRTINFRIPQRTPLNFQTTYVARLKSVDPAPFSQSKMPKTRPPKTPLNGLFTTNRIPVPPLFYTLFKRQKSWRIL